MSAKLGWYSEAVFVNEMNRVNSVRADFSPILSVPAHKVIVFGKNNFSPAVKNADIPDYNILTFKLKTVVVSVVIGCKGIGEVDYMHRIHIACAATTAEGGNNKNRIEIV